MEKKKIRIQFSGRNPDSEKADDSGSQKIDKCQFYIAAQKLTFRWRRYIS